MMEERRGRGRRRAVRRGLSSVLEFYTEVHFFSDFFTIDVKNEENDSKIELMADGCHGVRPHGDWVTKVLSEFFL